MNKAENILIDFYNEFCNFNSHYSFKINSSLEKLKECIESINYETLVQEEIYIYKKIKLNIQFLEYLQMLNLNEKVFCEKDKYETIFDT